MRGGVSHERPVASRAELKVPGTNIDGRGACQGTRVGLLSRARPLALLVESDEHLWAVCRYVERNALRAGLCQRAEDWRWCSLWRVVCGDESARALVARWPVARPADWTAQVNRPETELGASRRCANRGRG
jgi:putative transposase